MNIRCNFIFSTFVVLVSLSGSVSAQFSGGGNSTKSTQQGLSSAIALYREAEKYHYGNGVVADKSRAIVLYEKSCAKGYGKSCTQIGVNYEFTLKDVGSAIEFYKKGCQTGSSYACFLLGEKAESGNGLSRELSVAASYFKSACRLGDTRSCDRLKLPQFATATVLAPIQRPTPPAGLTPYRDPKKLLSGPFVQGGIGFMPFATEFEWLNFCFAAEQNGVSGIDTDEIIGSLTKDGRFSSYTAGKSPEQLAEFGKSAALSWLNFKKINSDEAQLTVESCKIHFPK